MGRHVTVNRLEISHIKRDALNTTYVCQASNTKLVPPAERTVRVEMLCEFFFSFLDVTQLKFINFWFVPYPYNHNISLSRNSLNFTTIHRDECLLYMPLLSLVNVFPSNIFHSSFFASFTSSSEQRARTIAYHIYLKTMQTIFLLLHIYSETNINKYSS